MSCTYGKGDCPPGQSCALDGRSVGKCVDNRITNFVPGPPIDQLPKCMQAALANSRAGTQTEYDDAVMGKLGDPINTPVLANIRSMTPATYTTQNDGLIIECQAGTPTVPYCQQDKYKNTVYCACQNVNTPNAVCVFAQCQSSEQAYRSSAQQRQVNDAEKLCPNTVLCQNILTMGGQNNVANLYQTSNCGNATNTAIRGARKSPVSTVLVLIMVVLLAAVLALPLNEMREKAAPAARPPGLQTGRPKVAR